MHIVSILTSLTSGGAEMLVVNLNNEYVAKGHKSTVITLVDAVSVGNSAEMENTLHQRIIAGGGNHISLSLGTSRNPFSGWKKMRVLLQSLKPDVIHAHTARALLMLLANPVAAPVLLTHHNSKLSFPTYMFKLFDRVVAGYVAISKEAETIFARHVARSVTYIPNAASNSFTASAARKAPSPNKQVLSVGTISHQKHYDLLVEAAVVLKSQMPPSDLPHFLIAGNGVDLGTMRDLVQERGVADNVTFLGERSDIAALMAQSDLYLNCSRYEGMPVSLLEAMASGLPIVATRVAGNVELVLHEQNGLLCEPDNPTALGKGVMRLLSDEPLYHSCSQAAVKNAGNFSIEATAANHIALFEQLAAK